MINYNPLLCCDFYKSCHCSQLPESLTKFVSYYTPRMSRLNINKVPLFGLQAFINEYLINAFNAEFFNVPYEAVRHEYLHVMRNTLGTDGIGEKRLKALHDLGYLPVKIRALPEGTRSDIGVPQIEISTTHPDFPWVGQALETMLSASMWHTQISAEIGYQYRLIVNEAADITCDDNVNRAKLLGDFSMRGQESIESATKSSAAFCLSFLNTATVPAIMWLENHYDCNCTNDNVAYGAISTEHSVMCSNYAVDGDEITGIRRLLTEIYPDQSFSMVSDSYDYWNLVDNILPQLKDEIMHHNGTLLIRGDSGDPVQIVTETVRRLWNTFGGTVNSKGYKVLNPHIKAIYGDSITLSRCRQIYNILIKDGFSIQNVALGVGSFSMQCLEEEIDGTMKYSPFTRDTFGIAVKATYAEDNEGNPVMIHKQPKTDNANFKKSHKGCCRVTHDENGYHVEDGLTWAEAQENNDLVTVFEDGAFVKSYTLDEVRNTLHNGKF